jgi:DNA-binding NarL/FixJ family response regulator
MLLDHEPGMVVMGITDRLTGLLIQLEATQPDVLLLEREISFTEMEDLLSDIHKRKSRPKIIFLSSKPEEERKILAMGADYFISTDAPPDKLLPILKLKSSAMVRISNHNN